MPRGYPPGNVFTSSYEKVGFIDHLRGNWQLAPNSSFRKKTTDGQDPGVDFSVLNSSGVSLARVGAAK
jgi:hypothetical protein